MNDKLALLEIIKGYLLNEFGDEITVMEWTRADNGVYYVVFLIEPTGEALRLDVGDTIDITIHDKTKQFPSLTIFYNYIDDCGGSTYILTSKHGQDD